ncbi:MAG: TIGR03915 family putative DNA repair protein [Dissulfuribacterales bacterium]
MTIFVCEDDLISVLKGAFYIHETGVAPDAVRIAQKDPQQGLFENIVDLRQISVNVYNVLKIIQKTFSPRQISRIQGAFLRGDRQVFAEIMQFVALGLKNPQALQNLTIDCVRIVRESADRVYGEVHRMKGFVRFARLADNRFYAAIKPVHNVLPLIKNHFVARFGETDWVIYDKGRGLGLFCTAGKAVLCQMAVSNDLFFDRNEAFYAGLWRTFFEKVAIKERENPRLQRQKVPLFYRDVMTEFM